MNIFCPIQKIKLKNITRQLGNNSQSLVSENDFVTPADLIGEKKPSAGFHIVNVAGLLKIPPSKASSYILRKEGERIFKGELLAEHKKMFNKDSEHVTATVDGLIQQINKNTGQIMIKMIKKQEFVPSGVWGQVTKIEPSGQIHIKAPVLQLNGKAGRGYEREGTIKFLENKHEILREYSIKEEYSGKILIGGSLLTREAITKAVNIGVVGFVVGGINYDDILLINPESDIGISIVVTEGYGAVQINESTYNKLQTYDNYFAFINGKEQSLSIPLDKVEEETDLQTVPKTLKHGISVRIFTEEYISSTGTVSEIIDGYSFPSGLIAPAVKILTKNKEIVVPQSNIEIIV